MPVAEAMRKCSFFVPRPPLHLAADCGGGGGGGGAMTITQLSGPSTAAATKGDGGRRKGKGNLTPFGLSGGGRGGGRALSR